MSCRKRAAYVVGQPITEDNACDAVVNNPDNETIVAEAIKYSPGAIYSASPKLKCRKEIALQAVKRHGGALGNLSEEFRQNVEIVKASVSQNGLALQFATDTWRNDNEIVKAAARENGLSIQFASYRLQGGGDIDTHVIECAAEAATQNANAIDFFTVEL